MFTQILIKGDKCQPWFGKGQCLNDRNGQRII